MFQSILQDIKNEFQRGSTSTRLIIANIAVFVVINLIRVFTIGWAPGVYNSIVNYLALHANIVWDLTHPWVFFTSLFMHSGFWHILWNMLFLFWFGRIVSDLIGDHKILPIYILGGLVGGFVFILSSYISSFVSANAYAVGASAAIMALVVAAGALAPDYNMRLILIGDVKLKYIVITLVLLDLFGTANMGNTGGHFAHLGGAFTGAIYVMGLHNGRDFGAPIERVIKYLRKLYYNILSRRMAGNQRTYTARPRLQVIHKESDSRKIKIEREDHKDDLQAEVDRILDKIKEEGYENLSEEEKETLYKASKS